MLDLMRRSANSWLIVLLFAAIIFVFAINFGPWAGNVGGQVSYAADVNGRVVTVAEFQSAYSNQFRMMQTYRPGYTSEQADAEGLRQIVLDQLVAKELLAQLGQKHGLWVSDLELATFIKDRFFGKDKPFDREAYRRAIYSNYQITEAQFEAQLRRELLADRVAELLGTGAYVTDVEVKSAFENRYNRVSLDVLRIDPKAAEASVKVNEADASQWAAKNEGEIKKYYDQHLAEFKAGKQVRARHILIKFSAQASDADKKAARVKIDAIQGRLAKGADFATVAKEASEDTSSKAGGDLGFFGEGAMVKPFEEAAFKLSPGQVSEVVESPFGYHLIKVGEIKPPVSKELKDVQNLIAMRIMQEQQQKAASQKLANEVLADAKSGADFAKLAKAKGPALHLSTTGLFRQDTPFVPEIGVNTELVAAAFALSKDKPLAEKVFESNGAFYIVRLKDREQADMAQFDKEKSTIRASLQMGRQRKIMQDYVSALKKDATIAYNVQIVGPAKT